MAQFDKIVFPLQTLSSAQTDCTHLSVPNAVKSSDLHKSLLCKSSNISLNGARARFCVLPVTRKNLCAQAKNLYKPLEILLQLLFSREVHEPQAAPIRRLQGNLRDSTVEAMTLISDLETPYTTEVPGLCQGII